MKKSIPSGKELLRICGGFSVFGGLNILFQLLFIPTSAALFLYKQTNIGLILFSLGSLPLLVSLCQSIFHRVKIKPLLGKGEENACINQLKKCLFINVFCCIPLFGLITAFSGAQAHCLLDEFRYGKKDVVGTWKKTCLRCLNSFLITHIVCIVFGNAFGILLAFHEKSQVYYPSLITLIFISIWGLVSGLINGAFSHHNILLSYKVRENGEVIRLMGSWRKSIKSNFIVYIPLLGVFALIPFFISRVIFKDMEMEGVEHKRQYIKKCKVFIHILIWGSFISLPYLICISLLGKWHNNSWLVIPLGLNLIATSALNFCLSCEQEVYANMYLMKEGNGERIKKINVLSKVCAGLIICTFITALPALILLLKHLRDYGKEEENIGENKMKELTVLE